MAEFLSGTSNPTEMQLSEGIFVDNLRLHRHLSMIEFIIESLVISNIQIPILRHGFNFSG